MLVLDMTLSMNRYLRLSLAPFRQPQTQHFGKVAKGGSPDDSIILLMQAAGKKCYPEKRKENNAYLKSENQ